MFIMVKTRRIDPEFRATTPVVKLVKKTFIGVSIAVSTVTICALFGLKDYFPLFPEREVEREHRKDVFMKDEYRRLMEEVDKQMKDELKNDLPFTNIRPTHK